MWWKHGAPLEWSFELVNFFPSKNSVFEFYSAMFGMYPPFWKTTSWRRWIFGIRFPCLANHVALNGLEEIFVGFERGRSRCVSLPTLWNLSRGALDRFAPLYELDVKYVWFLLPFHALPSHFDIPHYNL
jgi:hypothetical protein